MKRFIRLLAPFLLLVAWLTMIGITMAMAQPVPGDVSYDSGGVPVIVPLEAEVCQGGTIRYPLVAFIGESELPGQINVAEAWCIVGLAGGCIGVVPDRPDMPLLRVREVRSESTPRIVPDNLKPGVYEFWHSTTDSRGNVAGYIVGPINVLDCQAP